MPLDTATRDRIDNLLKEHRVVLFMKGTRHQPMCGFSAAATNTRNELLPDYHTVDVLEDPEIRQGIKEYANWPTIPQLYVKGEFVGGCDIVREMFQAGELQQALKEKGLAVAAGEEVGKLPGGGETAGALGPEGVLRGIARREMRDDETHVLNGRAS